MIKAILDNPFSTALALLAGGIILGFATEVGKLTYRAMTALVVGIVDRHLVVTIKYKPGSFEATRRYRWRW